MQEVKTADAEQRKGAEYVSRILEFLDEIGIPTIEQEVTGHCFVPGIVILRGVIYYDRTRMLYPGDLLHEAGHVAVTLPEERPISATDELKDWPSDGDEIATILWSFAAANHLQIPLDIVFHEFGYKNDSEWLIEQFESETYIGLPLLEWMGLCHSKPLESDPDAPVFPKMIKWLR